MSHVILCCLKASPQTPPVVHLRNRTRHIACKTPLLRLPADDAADLLRHQSGLFVPTRSLPEAAKLLGMTQKRVRAAAKRGDLRLETFEPRNGDAVDVIVVDASHDAAIAAKAKAEAAAKAKNKEGNDG